MTVNNNLSWDLTISIMRESCLIHLHDKVSVGTSNAKALKMRCCELFVKQSKAHPLTLKLFAFAESTCSTCYCTAARLTVQV